MTEETKEQTQGQGALTPFDDLEAEPKDLKPEEEVEVKAEQEQPQEEVETKTRMASIEVPEGMEDEEVKQIFGLGMRNYIEVTHRGSLTVNYATMNPETKMPRINGVIYNGSKAQQVVTFLKYLDSQDKEKEEKGSIAVL